jgi:hypothetical protein
MNKKKVLLLSFAALLSGSTLMAQTGQWKLAGNSLNGTQKLGSTNNFSLDFITNNVKRMSLTNTGNLRFNSDQSSIQFPNPGSNPKPMMFIYQSGNINTSRMVFAYSPLFPDYGLRYNGFDKFNFTDGTSTALNVDLTNSSIGIGTTNNENFKLKIVHGNNLPNGLAIENSTLPGIEWSLFTGSGNGPLNFVRDGAILGQISFPTGQYLALSDERSKTNIRPMATVLEKIQQLKPSTYQFAKAADKQDYDGFIAQDIMKIFPSLVSHTVIKESNTDLYTMNYSGFGVIAIKGIQELMKINEEKDAKMDSLQKQIDELKAIVLKNNQSSNVSQATIHTTLNDASLEQNMPNPFSNTTTIHYTLPGKSAKAQIIITDKDGKTIKQINISGAGKGIVNVDASAFAAGVFNYSLVVDGKLIATKQMVFTK